MLTAVQAKVISDSQTGGGMIDASLLDEKRTGNRILDEANHNVLWAAMTGLYNATLNINNFSNDVIENALTTFGSLGYTVDSTRRRSYKEIVLSWD